MNGVNSIRSSSELQALNLNHDDDHKNQLTVTEKESLSNIFKSPCEAQIEIIVNQIVKAREEIYNKMKHRSATLQPLKLREAQYYREYPISPSRSDEMMKLFTSSISTTLGYFSREVVYSKKWAKAGQLAEWKIQIKRKKNKYQTATLKIYIKNSFLRVEVAFKNPTLLSAKVSEQCVLLERSLKNLMNKAEDILNKIHKQLKLPRIIVSPSIILRCLKLYGFKRPENHLSLIEMCRQISETGTYDSTKAKREGLGLNDYQLQKLSHPVYGMLEKSPTFAFEGKNKNKYVRVLRSDYMERASAYSRHKNKI